MKNILLITAAIVGIIAGMMTTVMFFDWLWMKLFH